MRQKYIWQHENWPRMTWNHEALATLLAEVNLLRGQLLGRLSVFGFEEQGNSVLESITQEIIHSAEIEGELLNRDSVRSSVARQLGLSYEGLPRENHFIEGVVQVMMDATQCYDQQLTKQRLWGWHAALFPTGYSGPHKITVADWRKGSEPMQVVSGAMGRETVHYEAPQSDAVDCEMKELLEYVNGEDAVDPIVKAAIVHLWFVTIHPFDDGNGRLGRTLTEMMLSKADCSSQRYYSLSSEILNRRKEYYEILEKTQKGNLDVTEWVEWFLFAMRDALQNAINKTDGVMRKVEFWDKHRDTPINERQRKVLNMLFDGFEGKLNSSKWYRINHCSQDTATRDIKDLVEKGILRSTGEGGRSTNYELV